MNDFLLLFASIALYVGLVLAASTNGIGELQRWRGMFDDERDSESDGEAAAVGFGSLDPYRYREDENVPLWWRSVRGEIARKYDDDVRLFCEKARFRFKWPWLSMRKRFGRAVDYGYGVAFSDRRIDASLSQNWLVSSGTAAGNGGRVILVYVHGGAMLWGSVDSRFFRGLAAFARNIDVCATCRYTLASDGTEPAATRDLLALCESLILRHRPVDRIVVCAYSSGAYLAMKMCVALSCNSGCVDTEESFGFSASVEFPETFASRDKVSYLLLAGFYRLSYHELNDVCVTSAFEDLTGLHLSSEKDREKQDPLYRMLSAKTLRARCIYVMDATVDSVTYQSVALLRSLRAIAPPFPVYYEFFPPEMLEPTNDASGTRIARASVTWLRRHSFPFIPRREAGVRTFVAALSFACLDQPSRRSSRVA